MSNNIFADTDSPGSLLDFSIIRDSEQLHLAILSNFQDKYLVTLLMISDHILYEGNFYSILNYLSLYSIFSF